MTYSTKPHQQVRLIEISDAYDQQRLDNFLKRELKGVPTSMIYRIIRKGEVRVNKKRAKNTQKLCQGDLVRIPPIRMSEPTTHSINDAFAKQLEAAILFEDKDLLVIK